MYDIIKALFHRHEQRQLSDNSILSVTVNYNLLHNLLLGFTSCIQLFHFWLAKAKRKRRVQNSCIRLLALPFDNLKKP